MSVGNWSSPLNYAYDATGNETRKSDSTSGKNFTLATSSNRVSATYPDGSSPTSWTYDAMGNLVTDAVGHTLSYDVKGRLAQAIFSGSLARYTYDAFGNRKTKVIAGTGATSVIFMEGDDGELLGSYTPTGSGAFSVQEERVGLDDGRTIATIRPSPTAGMSAPIAYPILTDQFGAPRKVLGPATGAVIWLWDSKEAYGYQSPNEDPGSTGSVFHLNARMPGQELDAETGFFHNGFRDYDPASGRYVESDPLGLAADWNAYVYVGGDPVMMRDPLGLVKNFTPCSYYPKMASSTGNSYYVDAYSICMRKDKSVNLLLSVAWRFGTHKFNDFDSMENFIRYRLVQEDKNQSQWVGDGCYRENLGSSSAAIDAYHRRTFRAAGLSDFWYGGDLWPSGVWPNPVPRYNKPEQSAAINFISYMFGN